MQNKKQIFKKQMLIIVLGFLVLFIFPQLGKIIDYGGYFDYDSLYTDFAIFLLYVWVLLFSPLLAIYLIRLKRGGDFKNPNRIYKIIVWLFISCIVALFLFGVWERFYLIDSSYYLSIDYLTDIDGLVDDLKSLLLLFPLILVSVIFYWSIKASRELDKI